MKIVRNRILDKFVKHIIPLYSKHIQAAVEVAPAILWLLGARIYTVTDTPTACNPPSNGSARTDIYAFARRAWPFPPSARTRRSTEIAWRITKCSSSSETSLRLHGDHQDAFHIARVEKFLPLSGPLQTSLGHHAAEFTLRHYRKAITARHLAAVEELDRRLKVVPIKKGVA